MKDCTTAGAEKRAAKRPLPSQELCKDIASNVFMLTISRIERYTDKVKLF
jgi:hypothetical protein